MVENGYIISFLFGTLIIMIAGIILSRRNQVIFRVLCIISIGCYMVSAVFLSKADLGLPALFLVFLLLGAVFSITKILNTSFYGKSYKSVKMEHITTLNKEYKPEHVPQYEIGEEHEEG